MHLTSQSRAVPPHALADASVPIFAPRDALRSEGYLPLWHRIVHKPGEARLVDVRRQLAARSYFQAVLSSTDSEKVLTESARVSSMLDCFISVEQGSSCFAIACSESNSELVRLCLGFEICNSSTNRFYPRHITTHDVRFWSIRRWNFKLKSIVAQKLYDAHLDNWSNHCSSWNCCIGSWIWVCPRRCLFSTC